MYFFFFSLLLMQFVLQNNDTQYSFAKCSCPHGLLWPQENKLTEVTDTLFRKTLSYILQRHLYAGTPLILGE